MRDPECTLGLANCERVTAWPAGWQLVAIVAVVVGGIWVYRRSR
jgi:hypothetical protein